MHVYYILLHTVTASCLLKFHPQFCLICFITPYQNDTFVLNRGRVRLTQILTRGPFFFVSVSLFLCLSIPLSLSHSGCSRLEVRGSGVGQDFPVGLPHSVNTGNCPNLHPCSADVPQHTLMNTHTNSWILSNSSFLFSSLSLPMIY